MELSVPPALISRPTASKWPTSLFFYKNKFWAIKSDFEYMGICLVGLVRLIFIIFLTWNRRSSCWPPSGSSRNHFHRSRLGSRVWKIELPATTVFSQQCQGKLFIRGFLIVRVGIGLGEITGCYIPPMIGNNWWGWASKEVWHEYISTKTTLFYFWWIILGKARKLVAWKRVISSVKHLKSHTSLQSRILAFKLSTKLKHFRDICKSCKIRFPDNSIIANCSVCALSAMWGKNIAIIIQQCPFF